MQQIKENVFSVGANDPERRLFDEIIPLPEGTSYNAYLIKGSSKTALIDTVDPTMSETLLKNIEEADAKKIDYVIANHAEQDHSGTLPKVLQRYPEAKLVCTEKCKEFLRDLLKIPEGRFIAVKDRETIELGNKTLEFVYTPWVHWPETMVTYLQEDKIIFSCDFFGSHLAAEDLFQFDEKVLYKAAKRYFAEIMMPFRIVIRNNIAKLSSYDIEMIAPSHGPVYTKPEFIIRSYKDWISDEVKNLAIIAYVSMHGSTKEMADYLSEALTERGVEVHEYNLTTADIGEVAIDLVDAATLVIGTPCFLSEIHPAAANAAYLVNALRPKTRFVSVIGSLGWGGRIVEGIQPMIKNLKVEVINPVIIKGVPKEKDFEELDKLASLISEKHKSLKNN